MKIHQTIVASAFALAAMGASAANAATDLFTFYNSSNQVVASGSFSYDDSKSGVLGYADLSSFTIKIDNPIGNLDQKTYDLSFANSASDYVYFAYDTSSNSFVPAAVSGYYGPPYGELMGAITNGGNGAGFYLDPLPGSFGGNNDDGVGATYPFGANNGSYINYSSVTISAAPEPATWAMFLVGFGAIGFMMRNSRRKVAAAAA